jgi:lipopolysaccharide transport system ATP-binding protein
MKPIVEVRDLSKLYRLGATGATSLRETLGRWFGQTPVGPQQLPPNAGDRAGPAPGTFWALKDVSFEVQRGDALGVIGRNGAGKSTLLKILSRITEPTAGRAVLRGRVVSLLEVGTGFHPELSGRENIFLNGVILGMKRAEIAAKFDEIVDFAEIGSFIDTPVKRYSSGMYVRLAFAVAAHLEAEILIVDEVLAVGDAMFQQKCLGKMGEVTAKQGHTVLFVSHNMAAIRGLCERALLIHDGQLAMQGPPAEVISRYLSADRTNPEALKGEVSWEHRDAPGNDELRLRRICLCAAEEEAPQSVFEADQAILVEIQYEVSKRLRGLRFHVLLQTPEGELAFAATDHLFQYEEQSPGTYRTTCTIPARLLNRRTYVIAVGCGIPGERWIIPDTEYLSFNVVGAGNQASLFPEKWPGTICPATEWKVERCTESGLISQA